MRSHDSFEERNFAALASVEEVVRKARLLLKLHGFSLERFQVCWTSCFERLSKHGGVGLYIIGLGSSSFLRKGRRAEW